jgi:catechol 2,3-dioxygenase-like lactoylglutathione lyase family enzyme
MKSTKAGIILNTQKYQECIEFYGTILGLDIVFKIDRPNEKITTFALGEIADLTSATLPTVLCVRQRCPSASDRRK